MAISHVYEILCTLEIAAENRSLLDEEMSMCSYDVIRAFRNNNTNIISKIVIISSSNDFNNI